MGSSPSWGGWGAGDSKPDDNPWGHSEVIVQPLFADVTRVGTKTSYWLVYLSRVLATDWSICPYVMYCLRKWFAGVQRDVFNFTQFTLTWKAVPFHTLISNSANVYINQTPENIKPAWLLFFTRERSSLCWPSYSSCIFKTGFGPRPFCWLQFLRER